MKIKITQCSDPSYWYADKIGQEFEVIHKASNTFLVKSTPTSEGSVFITDCQDVNEEISDPRLNELIEELERNINRVTKAQAQKILTYLKQQAK